MKDQNADVWELVREQYEKFPYPPPMQNFDQYLKLGVFPGGCPKQHFHWFWPYRERTQQLEILVAGCGTSQAAGLAVHVPEARITAVDISRRSIDCTRELIKNYNIHNIGLHEMRLEDIGQLNKRFDLIFCEGVLHHLPDPQIGLLALSEVLDTEGSMYLMLYGKYGRDGVYIMQELFRRIGLSAGTARQEDINAIREFLKTLPASNPVSTRMVGQYQNMNVSDVEIVDLFLHPQDRAYTIPEIYDFLETSGLTMQKLVHRAHYSPNCSNLRNSPFYSRVVELPLKEQFAIGELYRAAVMTHYFVACPIDRPTDSYVVSLDSENWQQLIPVLNPLLRSTRERLPTGTVRTIFSPTHQFNDIFLSLDAEQSRILDLIDGERSISEIQALVYAPSQATGRTDQLRSFLSTLFDFDYVWFRGKT